MTLTLSHPTRVHCSICLCHSLSAMGQDLADCSLYFSLTNSQVLWQPGTLIDDFPAIPDGWIWQDHRLTITSYSFTLKSVLIGARMQPSTFTTQIWAPCLGICPWWNSQTVLKLIYIRILDLKLFIL